MKALLIIADDGFQPLEYALPKKILESAGIKIVTASKKIGTARSSSNTTAKIDVTLSQIKVSDYDAILFIGGPGAVIYQQDKEAHRIILEAVKEDKIIGAICIAPTILAYAEILKNKKVTVWNNDGQQSKLVQSKGALYTGEKVTVDEKIVTANGPDAAEEFARKILSLLTKP